MCGKISSEIFEMARWLLPGVRVDVVLTRNSPEFCLDSMNTEKNPFKFTIEEFKFYLKTHAANPEIVKNHQTLLSRGGDAMYALKSFDVRSFQIPIGVLSFLSESLFPLKIPGNFLLGLVSSAGYYGSLSKSGFMFKDYGVGSISIKSEENNLLFRSLKVDYENSLYQIAYQSIFGAIGQRQTGNYISREEYAKNYCLYLFELIPSEANELYPEKKGIIKVCLVLLIVLLI